MRFGGMVGKFHEVTDWIIKFVYVNILWIIFSLLGLVLVGFFPATTAMFAVVRKWIMGQHDIPIFKSFLKAFQTEFKKANTLGYILVIIGAVLYMDSQIVQQLTNPIWQLLQIPLFIALVIFALMALYAIPLFTHYHLSYLFIIRNAVLLVFKHPMMTILMGLSLYGLYVITMSFPAVAVLFGGSITSFVIMRFSLILFEKNEQRQEEPVNEETAFTRNIYKLNESHK
ncbi:YesL family protein [Alkalihalobacillus sp. MEB130]|uniref:YesL family protein n=1 Tax=Alkalihalobacillus sp. MEB130 TaxID=2976704 RepID=UPI0028DF5515|nr:YesL family protein [Alkalihalobacillus sp. MEB130]MDT8860176.1 YesL family protein [Alkalihalobacillus sp. MEB130]